MQRAKSAGAHHAESDHSDSDERRKGKSRRKSSAKSAPESADEFIDIDKEEEKDDFVSIEDQNETGRNFAAETFKRVEKQVVDAYDMLADDQDRDMFYDYLVTNLLLYFDKFEADLATTLPDVTTPEYEEEKDSVQAVDNEEETPDLGLDL